MADSHHHHGHHLHHHHKHEAADGSDPPAKRARSAAVSSLREVPYMGVIFVVAEAVKLGFSNGHPDWSNLGQGQPEVGPMEGAPPRITSVTLEPTDHAYGPLEGLPELRQAVANMYNRLFRKGKASQYGPENVAIACGGRLALTRAFAALGKVRVGYQTPDYTAYEDYFNYNQGRVSPVLLATTPEEGFRLSLARLVHETEEKKLDALLLSNPCNPTGSVIQGEELQGLVRLARDRSLTLLLDEFYNHFIYTKDGPVSAAEFVEDVNEDPVLLFDGLTKSHRYPGWRIGWVVGPKAAVETMARTASALDGGPSRVAQRAALQALAPGQVDAETTAVRRVFHKKRDAMVKALREMGITVPHESDGTFYIWASLEGLPEPLNNSMNFFRAALRRKVLTVPGPFFDINPAEARRSGESQLLSWMRFSFGPPRENMEMGLRRLAEMVADARAGKPVED